MKNTYPTKTAMRRNKSALPQVSPRGGVWYRARQGAIHINHRFLYRGYLQIAVLDLTRSTLNELWLITWAPTESPRGARRGIGQTQRVCPAGASCRWGGSESTHPEEQRIRRHRPRPRLLQLPPLQPPSTADGIQKISLLEKEVLICTHIFYACRNGKYHWQN